MTTPHLQAVPRNAPPDLATELKLYIEENQPYLSPAEIKVLERLCVELGHTTPIGYERWSMIVWAFRAPLMQFLGSQIGRIR